MSNTNQKSDKLFLSIVMILILSGLAFFVSASLGVLAKNEKNFYEVLISQLGFGFGLGLLGMYIMLKVPYKTLRKMAFYIFILALVLTALVYVPGLGWSHGGARRWISLLGVSFQPAEILKFAFIIYLSAYLSGMKEKVKKFKYGILPFMIMLGITGALLLNQPDTKSFILITGTGLAMLFLSEIPFKQILGVGILVSILAIVLIYFTPYLQARINTFLNPSSDSQGSSYQIQQSLIAVGSGGIFGRGYGQSIQKFSYLPEAQGDSIFAVIGEEFGFVGSTIVILLFIMFFLRGMKIAKHAPDNFSRLLVSGIVILIIFQSFLHIASVIGVFPLTGVPLVFMSHGGTALTIYMMAVGIVLQISKHHHQREIS